MEAYRRRVVRAWAGFDLAVTGLLVLPPVARAFLGLLLEVNAFLGGAGPERLTALGLLFVCITGALGVVWAAARLLRPTRVLGGIDAGARLWVGALIAWFVVTGGVPAIFLLFTVSEWAGGLHQGWTLLRPGSRARA
ncbi:hypothetical protein PC39_01760 [Salinisphaera sp. PC39]|uniref:hypothetical protein n=1 Tax=Salinisphaera sp. PC39 TaxID=1304156 RepID=UPI003340C64E